VTSADSWNSLTNKLDETQKTNHLYRMATFILYLRGVDNFIFNKNILASLDSDDTPSWKKTCRLSSKALHVLLQFHTLFTQL
jgi:hypothetical protein